MLQLRSELGELRNAGSTKACETVRQLEDLRGRFKVLDQKYEATQLEANGKAIVESRLTTAIAELDSGKLKMNEYEKEAVSLTQEIKECKTALLQSRATGERFQSQLEELQSKTDAHHNDLSRQLLQAEAKAKCAESGLDQMRFSAEKTISEEQEKHRKQREALQKRLDESQTELQMSNTEAEDTRAFVETTVRHQQEAWQKLHADLEFKVSEHKLSLELKNNDLNDLQIERDALQTQLTQLQARLQMQQESGAHRQTREAVNQGVIENFRHQYDAAQEDIASLQAVGNKHDRLEAEYGAREQISKDSTNKLQKEQDAAKALIETLQAAERQRKSADVARDARENALQKEMDDLQNERDAASAVLRVLRAVSDHRQNSEQATTMSRNQPASDTIVPPEVSEHSVPVKQRRKADRNTNTIVAENLRSEPQPTESRNMSPPASVFALSSTMLAENLGQDISMRPDYHHESALNRSQKGTPPPNLESLEKDEVLDSTPTRDVRIKAADTRSFGSSMQTDSTLNEAGFPKIKSHSSQAIDMSLDFSGKPLVSDGRSLANGAPSATPSQLLHSPGFQIYEGSQILVSDRQPEEESVRDNFTFRKPFPLSNSASKRTARTTSNKSVESNKSRESHPAPSCDTLRQPDKTSNSVFSQAHRTQETSNYAFGSSPEFMNPASTKVKRRYSGLNRPGGSSQQIRPPSSPMPDPRLVARSGAAKRGALQDSQQTDDPPAKRRSVPANTKADKHRSADESLMARSSQSVKDLPRVEDMNAGRSTTKCQSSHMRSSGTSTRMTRNQAKATKGNPTNKCIEASPALTYVFER